MFSQSCVSGFHRISDHGESRRARLSATTTPSWRHIWSSTHTKRPSLDHTRNCQPSPNQLSNFNLHSTPRTLRRQSPIDYAQLDHPPTANTSPPSSTRQNSNFNFLKGHRLPLFTDLHTSSQYTSHSSPTITHLHSTPRKPSPTPS